MTVPPTRKPGTNYADYRYQLRRTGKHEPEYWYNVFSENAIADAVLSRLANNGSKLTLIGEDMRTRD
ncbi:hypothetical protein ACL1FW_15015, partial [Corynebacterium striatum]